MNDLAKYLFLLLVFVLVCFTGKTAFAATANDDATCDIDAIVDGQVEWKENFEDIDITEHLTEQGDTITSDGTANAMLWTNGDLSIITAGDAQLVEDAAANDTLVTEYRLEYDGDGSTATGGSTVDYTDFSTFLTGGSAVTHQAGDGAVVLTLLVRASFDTDNVANAGTYSVIQTITATWP